MTDETLIYKWVDICLSDEDITNYEVFPKSADKGESYCTKVIFVKVKGKKKSDSDSAELDLVFKVSKTFNNQVNDEMAQLYNKEKTVYETVFPEFKKFTAGKATSEVFKSIPTCIKTFSSDEREIIVLKNLRPLGYVAHRRSVPMNFEHIKIILRNFAKFHAISYAFRDQRPQEFKNLFSDYFCTYKSVYNGQLRGIFHPKLIYAHDLIRPLNEELARKIEGILEKKADVVLNDLIDEIVDEPVITHGDSWNGNFLFTYEKGIESSPSKVAILDWQLSSLHSPVMDLSYFLFSVSHTEQVAEFPNLLKYYYKQFSESIRDLGSDPEKVFSYSKFQEHWKRYSLFGVLLAVAFMQFATCENTDGMELDGFTDTNEMLAAWIAVGKDNTGPYIERMLASLGYYFNLIEK